MKDFPGGIPDLSNTGKDKEPPFLEITLPAPPNMDMNLPITYGAHNMAHQQNYVKIANKMKEILDFANEVARANNALAKVVDGLLKEVKSLKGEKENE